MTTVEYKKDKVQKDSEKKYIIDKLKSKVPKSINGITRNIKLPEYIFFTINGNHLSIEIHEFNAEDNNGNSYKKNPTCENMQTDNAAFEGWAICLKVWLDNIQNVTLSWDIPEDKNLHYNRFCYRVLRFSEAFNDWFFIDDKNKGEIKKLEEGFKEVENIAYSKEPDKKKIEGKFGETEMEFQMATKLKSQILSKYNLDLVDRQFPVGLKKKGKQFFTGGMSAIDLWGLNSENSNLTVIELKYGNKNIKVGIISELFLYSCVMRDIVKGLIEAPIKTPKDNEQRFYDTAKSIKTISARMLATDYHPLIENDKVFKILNANAFQKNNIPIITFQKDVYSYDISKRVLTIQ